MYLPCKAVILLALAFIITDGANRAAAQAQKSRTRLRSATGTGGPILAYTSEVPFTTLQEVIDYAAKLPGGSITVQIPSGTYKEKLLIPKMKATLKLVGQSRQSTIITYDDYSGKSIPGTTNQTHNTATSYTVKVLADKVTMEKLTIQNTAGRVGQALALYIAGDQFLMKNSNLLGNQDTLCAGEVNSKQSRQFYKNCYIEGTTDFIFSGGTAVFDGCRLRSLTNSFITAASTIQENKYGFVFRNCRLEANAEAKRVYLGRPWRPYARTVFINTIMGSHILPAGWQNWNNPANEATAFYAEYGTTGVNVSERVGWSKQLTADEASEYTDANIFRIADGSTWLPK